MQYLVIDASGKVVNVVLWDGNPETWQPPEGCTTEPVTADTVVNFTGPTPSAGNP